MRDEIASLPSQLGWRPEIEELRPATRMVAAAMGGSAMAAAATALAVPTADLTVHRGYDLPRWTPDGTLVLAVSYSGNTEETLSAVAIALDRGLEVIAVTAGGRLADVGAEHGFPVVAVPAGHQPRAALGYQLAAGARIVAAACGADVGGVLDEAAAAAAAALADPTPAVTLAERLADRTPVFVGTRGPGALAAVRWKTQLNENAKVPAFAAEVPEMNHNALEAWSAGGGDRLGIVLLRDDADPRLARRANLTKEFLGPVLVGEVHARGDGPLARFLSLVATGDLMSVELAERLGVDPTPVPRLEEFKRRMRED